MMCCAIDIILCYNMLCHYFIIAYVEGKRGSFSFCICLSPAYRGLSVCCINLLTYRGHEAIIAYVEGKRGSFSFCICLSPAYRGLSVCCINLLTYRGHEAIIALMSKEKRGSFSFYICLSPAYTGCGRQIRTSFKAQFDGCNVV